MKIFVIGPIIPFTGGISHSNTTLCNNLSKRNDVTAISFSMMFPKLLYPGKSQKDGPPLKDTKFKQEFTLNTLNPVSWIRVMNKVRKERPDWIVFQWWHTYFFPSYFFITIFSKLLSAKVNVLCHNVLPHEEGLAKKLIHVPLSKLFFRRATRLTTLSKSELKVLKKLMPKSNNGFIYESSFEWILKKKVPKAKARKKLKLPNKKIVLFFGSVRPYKGLEDLFEAISNVNAVELVVAGAFWESKDKYKKLAKKLGIQNRVRIFSEYISDEEAADFFGAADLVVLSHRSATQSAIPQLAFKYEVPMIVTNVGGNAPFVDNNNSGIIVPPSNPASLAAAIKRFFSKGLSEKFRRGMKEKKRMFEWNESKEKRFFGGRE